MKPADVRAENTGSDWHEALFVATDLGLPSLFDIEWLLQKAECGEWSGL